MSGSTRALRAFAIAFGLVAMPLAAQEPPPLEVYGALPAIEDVAISPSGNSTAIVATIDGARRILVLDRGLELQRQLVAEGFKFRGLSFVGDQALVFRISDTVDVNGFAAAQYELQQAIVVSLAEDRPSTGIFVANSRLANSIFGSHGIRDTADGWRGFYGALEYRRSTGGGWTFDHGRPALYAVDFETMDARRVAPSPGQSSVRDWLLDHAGEVGATFDFERTSGSWTISNARRRTIAEGRNPNGNAGMMGFGHDGTTLLYFSEDSANGRTGWFEVPLEGGESRPFLDDLAIDEMYWDRGTGRLLGYLPEDAADGPLFHDPELQRRARLVRRSFANLNATMIDWTSTMDRVLMHTAGPRDSGTWFLVDVEGRSADPIGYDRPAIGSDMVGPTSMVDYTAADGLELDGVLTLPPGREAAGLPLIVLPHGGPQAHDEIGFDWWAQAFASRGYAVFQPNFRGSSGRGEGFVRLGFGQWGRAMQTDISDGVAHLAAQGTIDPQRACIVGASYGGYAALAGVTIQQGLYRCAVSVAGVSDITVMYETDNRESGRSRSVQVSLQEELGPRSGWADVSPRRLAERADAPILLIHGLDDTVVPFRQTTLMANALRDAGKPYRVVELAGEDHWLSRAETRIDMLRATMDFVTEHNPPE